MIKIPNLTAEERVYYALKSLYENFGYKQYKMRKFEEYSLYSENKNFLKSESVITFNDRNGKLLALKPDVTLSIVKNTKANTKNNEKLYYKESVYRLDKGRNEFKEISQIGVEFLGQVDGYSLLEILNLAAETLKAVDNNFMLDISHMGVLSGILSEFGVDNCPEKILDCIKSKNPHDMKSVCKKCNLPNELAEKLIKISETSNSGLETIEKVRNLSDSPTVVNSLNQLEEICLFFKNSKFADKINVDFSIVNDMAYYNGIVFQGYLKGFPKAVLSGGRYDNLVKKFRNDISAIGFALYLDEFGYYVNSKNEFDADVLLLYADDDNPNVVFEKANKLCVAGNSVRVEKFPPENLKFKRTERV